MGNGNINVFSFGNFQILPVLNDAIYFNFKSNQIKTNQIKYFLSGTSRLGCIESSHINRYAHVVSCRYLSKCSRWLKGTLATGE